MKKDFSSTVFHGLCKGGPLNGRTKALTGLMSFVPPGETGRYVYRPANGPTPSTWLWLEAKKVSER